MLTPCFTVRELPVKLSNINNLRFRSDGRLTALGYDGRIHILRDMDSDGLEDECRLFWDKPTLCVPVGMAWSKEGLYVTSHGKVSLLCDTDEDGKEDVEELVASGWPPTDVASGGVDHYDWTFEDPLFRALALRGVACAAGELVGRLDKQYAETGRSLTRSISQP